MRRPLVVLVAALLLGAACGGGSGHAGAPTSTTATVTPQNFSTRGPYAVGAARLALDADRPVVVFYPADPPAVSADATPFIYTAADTWGPLAAAVPPGLVNDIEVPGAWLGMSASTHGPFPLVIFSHGRGGAAYAQAFHYAQLASWGFVVAAPRHPTRDLQARLGGRDTGASDVTTILDTRQLLVAENDKHGGALEGRIAIDHVAVEGHSAGGRDAALAAYAPDIDAWISLAGAAPVPDDATGGRDVVVDGNYGFDPAAGEFDLAAYLMQATPPAKPALIIAADNDVVYPVSNHRAVYDWLSAPKRMAVLAATGHSVFFDTCARTQARGGMQAIADALGLDRSSLEIQLVEDGCLPEDAPVSDVTAIWNHLVIAQLRYVFGIEPDTAAASLERNALDSMFPGRLADYMASSGQHP